MIKRLTSLIVLILVAACGGDQKPLATNESLYIDSQSNYRLRLILTRVSDAGATTEVSSTQPGLLSAELSFGETPVASSIISFSTDLGAIQPNSGTETEGSALTNDDGRATIRLIPKLLVGAGTVTASVTLPGSTRVISTSLNFAVTSVDTQQQDSDINMTLSLTSDSGFLNTIRADDPGTLNVNVIDNNATPLTNTVINFSADLVDFEPQAGTALTDDLGNASIRVLAGDTSGVTTITATIGESEEAFVDILNIVINPPLIRLGSTVDSEFTEGQLDIGIAELSAGGTTSINVNVVEQDGSSFNEPLAINFSSPCIEANTAVIDGSVQTSNGRATAIYRASGCIGDDLITATLSFGGTTFTASGTLTVSSDTVGAIGFVDASPTTIVLRGTGGQGFVESSQVTFRVLGAQGRPIANEVVNFSLTTTVGGLTLSPAVASSDADGLVVTTVQSGNIPTSVVVTAEIAASGVSSQSGILVVSTGVPDQNSLTLSRNNANPEGWDISGTEVEFTAFAADQFNNPVPDGVQLSFTAEGGNITPSCTTVAGSCSVTWTAQNPRPSDGRATVLVTAVGAESFDDENGNGVFDDGDSFGDLSEAFRDDSAYEVEDLLPERDGTKRDAGEAYIDFNTNGVFDLADAVYSGPTCAHSALCSSQTSATVSDQKLLVMSGSFATISFNPAVYTVGEFLTVTIEDINGNTMPCGSSVSVSLTNGELVSGQADWTVGCLDANLGPSSRNYLIVSDGDSSTGTIDVTVESPSGVISGSALVIQD